MLKIGYLLIVVQRAIVVTLTLAWDSAWVLAWASYLKVLCEGFLCYGQGTVR